MNHLLLSIGVAACGTTLARECRASGPDRVKPQPFQAAAKNALLTLRLPAKSVRVLEVQP